ncbi:MULTISPECIES: VOC family protein [Pseudomonas]|uniref:VOC family protein n=1 Tax=Pseudomonas azadiae TaxID=2843612 RepID=A0ABS6P2P0_9PSED|nr:MULTISPECIES: VOC family protein [Pseudomonas]MBV4454726.1 VOC family protein [Pseudomonas azadiae]NMF43634.1 VOC family protein [Pseudomonas sp. SWRI 103]
MQTSLDHLVVVAPTLEAGDRFVSQRLGVALQQGGCHPLMGTHNKLLRLGTSFYLEVIAIDPTAPPAGRPRWFALDGLPANASPRLAHWVAKTDTLKSLGPMFTEVVGQVQPMSRGELRWDITILADGGLPLEGAAPSLIQWGQPVHPATMLEDRACSLQRLDIFHPAPERISHLLDAIHFSGPVRLHRCDSIATSRLVSCIETPGGLRHL